MWPRKNGREIKPASPKPGNDLPARQDQALKALLHRLNWKLLRPLATHFGGQERSILTGTGMELSEIREYQPGDDIRFIDWNVTARASGTFVREAQVERSLDVWLLLDLSASIDWGTALSSKRERALEFVATAGQLLSRDGNRLGAVLFADKVLKVIPPSTGQVHLVRLLRQLTEMATKTGPHNTGLAAALDYAARIITRRSLVLVVSDFITEDDWEKGLGKLTYRHEVVAAQVRDPRESELPDMGIITLEDPETGQQLVVDTSDRKLRENFRVAAQAQAEKLENQFKKSGVDRLVISTGEDLLPGLVKFLQARRFRHRRPLNPVR
ncbi:MAG: DUF58 domain-containing protein [Chloroflexi bacterium]|nr:DUF58 domain-containing protein [Chloroflexota bacterium]